MTDQERDELIRKWNRESKILGQWCANDLPGDPEDEWPQEYGKDARGDGPKHYQPRGNA